MPIQSTPLTGTAVNVAMMTSGGLAPCLSASIAQLVKYWVQALEDGKISDLSFRFYVSGYKGLLTGDSFVLDKADWPKCEALLKLGGSPIGNSRVKLTNVEDCIKKGYGTFLDGSLTTVFAYCSSCVRISHDPTDSAGRIHTLGSGFPTIAQGQDHRHSHHWWR